MEGEHVGNELDGAGFLQEEGRKKIQEKPGGLLLTH
jgi:hypothetical protein